MIYMFWQNFLYLFKKYLKKFFISIILLTVIHIIVPTKLKNYSTSYWIWGGITVNDAPANSELYIYQGQILTSRGVSTFLRVGLYPHPVLAQKLYLVYRLKNELPDPEDLISLFRRNAIHWSKHKVVVEGLQIDFDSATAKLMEYSKFLEKVRALLLSEYKLSITGLGDWAVFGDRKAIAKLANITDEVVFQLYQVRNPLPELQLYINVLKKYNLPFRIGMLKSKPCSECLAVLSTNANFKGVIYFIQKS